MLRDKKIWNFLGMAIGLALIIAGIVLMSNPPESAGTRDTDYATFGGDFYTYEYDATRSAARNAQATAVNVLRLGEFIAKATGIAMMAAGALVMVHHGKDTFVVEETSAGTETADLLEDKKEAQQSQESIVSEMEPEV